MRIRKQQALASATFLAFGFGAASNASAQLQLRGSDTLELVTKDAIAAAGILATDLVYIGGGSGAGENAMIAGTQRVSPMSRALNSNVADPVKCTASAQQLLVGLDGIAVVAGSQTGGDSLDVTTPTPGADDCSDNITGGRTITVPNCNATDCDTFDASTGTGTYTFTNWQDVLAEVYGGQNHKTANGAAVFTAPSTNTVCAYSIVPPNNESGGDAACPSGQVCFTNNRCGDPALVGHRNPSRVNCLNPVRQALVDSWASLFSDVAAPPTGGSCRTGSCTKLRHAYRRDDLSGTTDTFVGLVGLVAIANPTKAFINSPVANSGPIADRAAVASPFCSAGDRPMNKGDSDYLDLDPIRRAADHLNIGGNRFGQENLAQNVPSFGGNNSDAACNTLVGGVPHIPQDRGSPTAPGIWPDPDARRAVGATQTDELLTNDLGANFNQGGALAAPYAASTRLCLGLVLPVTLPANYLNSNQAYFRDVANPSATLPVLCTPGVTATTIADTRHVNAICPNGKSQLLNGGCDMPVALNPDGSIRTFNCMIDQINPLLIGTQDTRVYNIHPVDEAGHYRVDNYINPSIPVTGVGINAARQARVVSGYFRMHITRSTDKNGSVPTLGSAGQTANAVCNTALDSTEQIGCLVKANSCTIGYAGREAVDATIPRRNFAVRIAGITASTANIQNLVLNPPAVYPIARKLWFNSIVGFGSPSLIPAEQALFNFENNPANIDPIIQARNFVVVPSSVTRLVGCPAP